MMMIIINTTTTNILPIIIIIIIKIMVRVLYFDCQRHSYMYSVFCVRYKKSTPFESRK
jgi:hypothetical protein